jgi:hypothetical protein
MWRVAARDLEDYIGQAYRSAAERIASGAFLEDESGEKSQVDD